ncbi:MAG: ion transporter [Alphaproteobacteria bacterium]|nr:ion transporter [Alphaproteobacteria bacterium]
MERLRAIVESPAVEKFIMAVIVVNAITLGLETVPSAVAKFGPLLDILDKIALAIFVVELVLRLAVYRKEFFKDPWRVFDFVIVAISLAPASEGFTVLRALRILRVLRMITVVPTLRRVVGALIGALPGMGSIILLLVLVYYVFSVMATKLFGEQFPEWFGSIPASAYTLFQVMTLESWSMGIVRPVMEKQPWAWAFFVPFILCTTFTVLNLFIGIVVSAMQGEHEQALKEEMKTLEEERERAARDAEDARQAQHEENLALARDIRALRGEIAVLQTRLDATPASGKG